MKTTEKFKYLTNNEKKALKELKKEVLKLYPDAKLILFGSKVRGDFDEESDVDILVIVSELDFRKKKKIINTTTEINWKFNTNITSIVVDKEEFLKHKSIIPLYSEVREEGIFV